MRHWLVPSLEVLGAIPVRDLSDHSLFGSNPETEGHAKPNRSPYLPGATSSRTETILYVDRMPRQRHTDDCVIDVGFIAAWGSLNGASQGVLFPKLDEARQFIRLARRGIHTRRSFIFRAASIAKFNAGTGKDDQAIVVDAQLLNDRTNGTPEWITPWRVDPITRT